MTKTCTHDWEHLWYLWDGEKNLIGYGRKCRNCDVTEEENPEMILPYARISTANIEEEGVMWSG